jgi:hypothetical protein
MSSYILNKPISPQHWGVRLIIFGQVTADATHSIKDLTPALNIGAGLCSNSYTSCGKNGTQSLCALVLFSGLIFDAPVPLAVLTFSIGLHILSLGFSLRSEL